ncbi:MAG: hypothetical protein ACLQIB_41920 [Isosphaeraceae bacterium]
MRKVIDVKFGSFEQLIRKVYLGAVVILISAMRQGPTPRRVHELATLFGVDRATVARWQAFWRDYIECQGTERSFNVPRRAAHDAGAAVSGSAVSVPRVESPTKPKDVADTVA